MSIGSDGRHWRHGRYDGAAGLAWVWTGGGRDRKGEVATWVVNAAWAHPAWSQYVVFIVHLRDEPDLPPPKKHRDDVTHEFGVMALDPEHAMKASGDAFPRCLTPANMAYQFAAASDGEARERVRLFVEMVADGTLNPDTDARSDWDRFMDDGVPLVRSIFERMADG